jgi:hypothetical protein
LFDWLRRKRRMRRATDYLRAHPEDEPAAKAIYITVEFLGATSARQVAEITAGRPLSDEEWTEFGPRWERAWVAIMF